VGGSEQADVMEVSQYSATIPATTDGVLAARHFGKAVGVLSPRLDQVELVVCELAACAMRDSADGELKLTAVRHRVRGWLHVEVVRAVGKWSDGEDDQVAYAYGLMIVDGLAERWGSFSAHDTGGSLSTTATIWAELSWK
jgi:hypothetical protein